MTTFSLDDVTFPDSVIARKAYARATEALSPAIVAHSTRAFFFGSIVGTLTKRSYDSEALYVASMLHDFGFAKQYHSYDRAFETEGADAARQMLMEAGDSRGQLVWDAIAMHTVPHLAIEREREVFLLHVGSSIDAFGARIGEIPREIVENIFARYPRADLANDFAEVTKAIVARQPYCQLAAFAALGLRYLP